jgi:hypothetical protein
MATMRHLGTCAVAAIVYHWACKQTSDVGQWQVAVEFGTGQQVGVLLNYHATTENSLSGASPRHRAMLDGTKWGGAVNSAMAT